MAHPSPLSDDPRATGARAEAGAEPSADRAFRSVASPAPCDDVAVRDLGLDAFETGVLAVLRHLCAGFAAPGGPAWHTAFAIASERWGPVRGPVVVTGLLPILYALADTRQAPFRTMDALSLAARQWATPDEARLLRLLAAMRRDATAAARCEVAALAEGRNDPALIAAVLTFAARYAIRATHPAQQRLLH